MASVRSRGPREETHTPGRPPLPRVRLASSVGATLRLPLPHRLIGHWVLRGTIARPTTTHDVTFTWMLGREYVQMHEVSRECAANGTPAYEAVVLFARYRAWGSGRRLGSFPVPLHANGQVPYHLRLSAADGLVGVAHGLRQLRGQEAVCPGHADATLAWIRASHTAGVQVHTVVRAPYGTSELLPNSFLRAMVSPARRS